MRQLVFDSATPIYLQIARDIREQILAGELKAGDQLMSTTQYATNYRINPATANKAFNLLQDDGLIYKQRGIGMFVTEDAQQILNSKGRESFPQDHLEPALRKGIAYGYTPSELINLTTNILQRPSGGESA